MAEVRTPSDLERVNALIIPGGESTTMSKLLVSSGLFEAVAARLASGMPAFGTCAGMILLATEVVDGRADQRCFGVLDVAVRRNGFGRQVDSFEAPLAIEDMAGAFPGVFIRAPMVERVGPLATVNARVDETPVLCSQGHVMAAAFHPELSGDLRLHQRFVDLVANTKPLTAAAPSPNSRGPSMRTANERGL